MKKSINSLIKIIAFLVAFVLLVQVLSVTYFSKAQASNFKNKYSDTMTFYREPADSLQIVAIGNSDLYSGFCPDVIWEQNSFTSTAIGSPRQTPSQSYDFLKEVLSRQKPKLVIIETDMFYDSNLKECNVTSTPNGLDVAFDYLQPDSFEDRIKNQFSIFNFHDRWKNKKYKYVVKNNHGYKFSNNVVEVTVEKNFMVKTNQIEPISKMNLRDVNAIIECCKKNNIDIIFTTFPSPTSWNYDRHNAVEKIANENNIPYIDFNAMMDKINLDLKKDFRDAGNHMNFYGAQKVSKYLGNYIADNYDIENLSNNENYDYWNKNHKEFNKMAKKYHIK